MVERVEITETSAFPAALTSARERAAALDAPLFIHVRGSFCGDCTSTDAAVESAFASRAAPAVLLMCQITDPRAYSSPLFPYRTDPLLKVTSIPTIIRDGAGRLVEGECGDVGKLTALIG